MGLFTAERTRKLLICRQFLTILVHLYLGPKRELGTKEPHEKGHLTAGHYGDPHLQKKKTGKLASFLAVAFILFIPLIFGSRFIDS
jgi:hypothetical protein